MSAQKLTGQPVDLNVTGIHGTSDIRSKKILVEIVERDRKIDENIIAYSRFKINAKK